jgi:hypothetical protein
MLREIAARLLRHWRDSGTGIPSPRLAIEFAYAYLRPSSPDVDPAWLYELPPGRLQDVRVIDELRALYAAEIERAAA